MTADATANTLTKLEIAPTGAALLTGATKLGTVEKNVVLAFSLKLRDKLVASGRYKVLMTRDSDKFIALEERRDAGAGFSSPRSFSRYSS